MFKKRALMYHSVLFFGSFIAIGALATGIMESVIPLISEIEMFLYYLFAGSIGGSLRHLYLFCVHYVRDELDNYRVWIMYIFYPIFATGTAIVAVTIINSGILSIQFTEYESTPIHQCSIFCWVWV